MYLHGLTLEQQDFAEKNHNLVYSFLCDKKLPMDDYYDVVVFGYLRAVQQYCTCPDLRQRFTFGTIAYRKMKDDLYKHFSKQSRPSRKAVTISIESLRYGDETLTMTEIISGFDHTQESLDAKLLMEELFSLLTEEQIKALCLRVDGYTDREIAAKRKRRVSDVENIFADIQAAALGLCLI